MPENLHLRSLIQADGTLELSLASAPTPELTPHQVLVRMEAAPINPSDVGVLLAGANPADLKAVEVDGNTAVRGTVPAGIVAMKHARVDWALPTGNEGAGVVVEAGADAAAQALLGRTVAISGGGAYGQFRAVRATDCLVLDEGTDPRDGASSFINPMTALAMLETMRAEGHTAIVHTAAASNLGQMLNRLCIADGVPLVNIVRRVDQATLLREQGAEWVIDTSAADFRARLEDALAETGATLAFDATGGGDLANRILWAMEAALLRDDDRYHNYGSPVLKQVYQYGRLDLSPTVLKGGYGMGWAVAGWLMPWVLERLGAERAGELRARVARELSTTFASTYSEEITLQDMLDPAVIQAFAAARTGEKVLVRPNA